MTLHTTRNSRIQRCGRLASLIAFLVLLVGQPTYALWMSATPNPGLITATVNTPFEFAATGAGSFTFLGSDTAEFLGPNWRFSMKFFSTGSFIGINPFVFEHNSFLDSEGLSDHHNSAGTSYLFGTPSTFHFDFTHLNPVAVHALSGHYDEFSVVGDIVYDGQSGFSWSATFRASHVPGASAHACVASPSGLVAWWPGDGNFNDIADSNHGTDVGGVTFAPGMVGQAFNLDGVDDFVRVPHSASLNPSQITIDAWFFATAISGQSIPPIVKKAGEGFAQDHGYALEINNNIDGAIRFWVFIAGGWHNASSVSPVLANTWYHVAGTYDGSTINIYLNGQLRGSTTVAGVFQPSLNPLQIGADPANPNRLFKGKIDEVGIFNRALSASEVQAIYNAGSAGKCKSASDDLAITKSFPVTTVNTGSSLTSTITVTNNGSGVATNIVVMDNLPASMTFLSCTAPGGQCEGSGNDLTATFASLAAGATVTVTVEALVSCSIAHGSTIINSATVSSSLPDPDTVNNTAIASVTALNPPPVITCPANVSAVGNIPNSCAAMLNLETAMVSDNCAGATVIGNRSDGLHTSDPFPLGETGIVWTATDSGGNSSSCEQIVTVTNPSPVVTIIGPPSGAVYGVGTPVSFTGTFTDNLGGTHTAVWSFDSITQSGNVVEPAGASPGSANTTFTFTTAGIYFVNLRVADGCGGIGLANSIDDFTAMVVVYDPEGGSVTGGGWINSPAGAYQVDQTLTGKANFGFVSRYQPGAAVPTGQTEFQFKLANLNFHSLAYEWLVVAGARAQYKGIGTINGSGSYGFVLTAIDGQLNGGGGTDKFRIKIWDKDNNDAIIYDNKMGSDETSSDATELGGGSIVIHQ